MPLYFLTYDLRNERDYRKLHQELEAFGAMQVLESVWCIQQSRTSAEKLLKHFQAFVDKDDGLVLARVSDWVARKANIRPSDLT